MAKRSVKKITTKAQLNWAVRHRIESFEKQAEKIIAELAERRDRLRALVDRYSDLLECIDDGVDMGEDYLCGFERAIDRISEKI